MLHRQGRGCHAWLPAHAVGSALLWNILVGIVTAAAKVQFSLILDQDAPGYHANREAIALLEQKDGLPALKKLKQALQLQPGSVQLQNSVGVSLMYLAKGRQNMKEKLEEMATEAFQTAVALATRGGKGRQSKDVAESDLEVATANAKLAKRQLEANRLNHLGIELDRKHRWDEAAHVLRQALVAAEFDPRTANNLGTVIYKNATYRSSGWTEATPFYRDAQKLFRRALKHLPGNPAILKSIKEVTRLQSFVEAWKKDAHLLQLPLPGELRKVAGERQTLVCTWSGGGQRFGTMALNLFASIRQNAPHWASAFVVLSLDVETETFLRSKGVTTWLYATVDIFMTRWRLLAGLLALQLNVLLLDTDVVFLSDPFPHFFHDADLEVMTDHFFPERDLWDDRWRDEEHVNTGFMYAQASERSLKLVQDFVRAHHSPWDAPWDAQGVGLSDQGIFDLFDQRIFSNFLRRRLKQGQCLSLMENLTYGQLANDDQLNPSVRVHHPSVIAHGGAFFWLRSFRQRDLEVPPVAHANFGKNKQYFLRDRGLWFLENLTERFQEEIQHDEYYPPALLTRLPQLWRFLSYTHQPWRCDVWKMDPFACQFFELTATLEAAVLLGRRLVMPDNWDCSLLPMWEVYGMSSTFTHPREGCTFDYFADAEAFGKRFGHLLVEAGMRRNAEYQKLRSDRLHQEAVSGSCSEMMEGKSNQAILEVDDEVDVVMLRDQLRERDPESRGVARQLFPCRWVELNLEMLARRPGQAPAPGQRTCGVQGLDCCAVYHGWAEKIEYFTDIPWSFPCDCGVGAALGCVPRGDLCVHQDDPEDPFELEFLKTF